MHHTGLLSTEAAMAMRPKITRATVEDFMMAARRGKIGSRDGKQIGNGAGLVIQNDKKS